MAKKAEKVIYVTQDDDGGSVVSTTIGDAWRSVGGTAVTVEVYKLDRTVQVTQRTEFDTEPVRG